ncbi:uncharacterized protein A1O5_07086 [Cladophialophora psammophila CBS 110553]|uniref:Zn(2)-C6 fungal-type domain-containing protein n=1 Tax=Cladophialophora psammophila CBS 110553 TaxID=1182543 RepID=W9WQ28_9EURO|nr:uncharacterized protein A1O5_07086 [Cladophialophora psammophila CBS 110553]EXJ70013.1 hypothetical protein A1O5_07086 [Cladophialophora psammophila CBS 110553]
MAQPPAGDPYSRRQSLPPFSSLLVGASNPNVFGQPRREEVTREQALLSGDSMAKHAAQSNTFASSDVHASILAQSHTMNHPVWSYPNTSRSELQPTTSGPSATNASIDPGPGRATVEEDVIDGSGSCHTNEGGMICSRDVDGDGLNSTWSTTRANKLRKRTGQACDGCREKMMKCDFKLPKCTVCKNNFRECTLGSAPRATVRQSGYPMSIPPTSPFTSINRIRDGYTPLEYTYPQSSSRASMPRKDNMLSPVSDKQNNHHEDGSDNPPPAKRPRISPSPRPRSQGQVSASSGTESLGGSVSSPSATSNFSWDVDPYQLSRSLTMHYTDKYFEYVDSVTCSILPKELFQQWIRTCRAKSPADQMLLYAILAMGTVFASSKPESKHHQDVFLEIVNKAVIKNGDMFSLQLIQTKLILALFAFSQGQYNQAGDHCGSAVRIAVGLRYHMEEGVSTIEGQEACDFGLCHEMLVECRRRTFWSAYLMDSFSRCWSTSVATVSRSDCDLRLPCPEAAYEMGHVPLTPLTLHLPKNSTESQPSSPRSLPESSEIGAFGYLVEIAAIFNEVMSTISRGRAQSPAKDRVVMDAFRQDIMGRLKTWDQHIKKHVRHGRDGREKPSGFHILYHYSIMILNRYVHHAEMDQLRISVCARQVYDHARQLLQLIQQLAERGDGKHNSSFQFVTLSPFSGFAITAALDVITAAGPVSSLMGHESQIMALIASAIPVLEGLKEFWHSGRRQHEMADKRLRALLRVSSKASEFNGAYFFAHPIQSPLDLDHDIVYGLPRRTYFAAMGWEESLHPDGEFQRLD